MFLFSYVFQTLLIPQLVPVLRPHEEATLESDWGEQGRSRKRRKGPEGRREKKNEEKRENREEEEEEEGRTREKTRKHEKRREHVKYQGEASRTASRFQF